MASLFFYRDWTRVPIASGFECGLMNLEPRNSTLGAWANAVTIWELTDPNCWTRRFLPFSLCLFLSRVPAAAGFRRSMTSEVDHNNDHCSRIHCTVSLTRLSPSSARHLLPIQVQSRWDWHCQRHAHSPSHPTIHPSNPPALSRRASSCSCMAVCMP
jgi:hypothetical protein